MDRKEPLARRIPCGIDGGVESWIDEQPEALRPAPACPTDAHERSAAERKVLTALGDDRDIGRELKNWSALAGEPLVTVPGDDPDGRRGGLDHTIPFLATCSQRRLAGYVAIPRRLATSS